MDTQLTSRGLKLAQTRKKWVFLLAALGFSGYGVYKVYHSPSVANKRRRLLKLLTLLVSVLDAFSSSAEAARVLTKDLKEFLKSESDEFPNSLKQVSKIAGSDEFADSIAKLTQALTAGTLKGYYQYHGHVELLETRGDGDWFFDKLFSASGSGFASMVVGSFARNLVMALTKTKSDRSSLVSSYQASISIMPRWVNLMCSDQSKELIGDWIHVFVSTAVSLYLERTMNINPFDEFFAGVTNPKHEEKVKDTVVSVCNGAVEALVKTSHQVLWLTSSEPTGNSGHHRQNGYYQQVVSTTLSVPRNRQFVLDVTGRVTFETVTSVLEFLVEKTRESLGRSCKLIIHGVFANTGVEVARAFSFRAMFTFVAEFKSNCNHLLLILFQPQVCKWKLKSQFNTYVSSRRKNVFITGNKG
ncbi:hypothetical protein Dimus_014227 [Dionaea muscipula]